MVKPFSFPSLLHDDHQMRERIGTLFCYKGCATLTSCLLARSVVELQ